MVNAFIAKNSKIHHLGAKAVDDRYSKEIELSRTGIGCGQNLFLKKHKGIIVSFLFGLIGLMGNFIRYLICVLTFNEKKYL